MILVKIFADLMMRSSKACEKAVIRIAQVGRAAGVHLVIATQRPSVDVVTGLIKANIQTRLAFKTSSGTDSRVVLDALGAQGLLGKGDGLLRRPDEMQLVRMHGAFVSDAEVEKVVTHIVNSAQGAEGAVA